MIKQRIGTLYDTTVTEIWVSAITEIWLSAGLRPNVHKSVSVGL